jgi:hypothetical protein
MGSRIQRYSLRMYPMKKLTTNSSKPSQSKLHLDKRAEAIILAVPPDASDDDLLTTMQVANWFGVSTQWLEIGRVRDYGPPWVKLAPQMVRYKRSVLLKWLKAREYARTADYPNKKSA